MAKFSLWHSRNKKSIIDPDEVFIDSKNLPSFDNQQFEGRLERPIAKRAVNITSVIFILVSIIFLWRIGELQIRKGEALALRSNANKLRQITIFPERGIIYDRQGEKLAWNDNGRTYIEPGFGHLLGFVGLPSAKDLETNKYHPQEFVGRTGVEKIFNDILCGQKGVRIEEIDVDGKILSDHLLKQPESGQSIHLSIDSRLQKILYESVRDLAESRDFVGAAAVIMDVKTGEVIALTNYPEYDPNILSHGEEVEKISEFINNPANPFLNRAVAGLYTPGSIVKPFIAVGALTEGVINPQKEIISTGTLTLPNPYFPDKPSIFLDWRAHGPVDMRQAIAVSSNIYFYQIGGGYGSQKGIGISNIEKYTKLFGLSLPTGIELGGETKGVIPNPDWKAENFNGDPWRIGDTYNTSIGQYGFMVTPLQMVRATAILANGGQLVTPTIIKKNDIADQEHQTLSLPIENLAVAREGMRQAVTQGSSQMLNSSNYKVAAKTGTAQVGLSKEFLNSWIIGFFPYDNPRYAYAIVMERGPADALIGGVTTAAFSFFERLFKDVPEYLKNE